MVTLGSEATIVRDVIVEDCTITAPVNRRTDNPMPINRAPIALLRLKLRPDTPQIYEDIHFRAITLDGVGTIFEVGPGISSSTSRVSRRQTRSCATSRCRISEARFGSFGEIAGNPGQTEISDITLENIDVQLTDETLKTVGREKPPSRQCHR